MTKPNPTANDRPRLIIVVPVVLVCLGAIYLLLTSRKAARESIASAALNTNISASRAGPAASNQSVRRSAYFQVDRRRRTVSQETHQETQSVQEAIVLEQQGETKTLTPSDRIVSGPARAGAVVWQHSGIEIRGKVTLSGTPPAELTIDMTSDPKCGALHSQPISTRHYVVDSSGGLANVFVYVKSGLTGKKFPVPADAPLLDQVGCQYTPYVMGVQVNQKIRIKNSDPTLHNVHAIPKPGSTNEEFNFAQPVKNMVTEKSFPSPEVLVRFKCEVHPWMFGYVGVLEHPFFAVTREDGTFQLPPNLPPGTYTIEAHHLKAGTVSKDIEVKDGDKKQLAFKFEL